MPRSEWHWRPITRRLPSPRPEGSKHPNGAQWFAWPSRFWSIGAAALETVFDAGLRHAQTEQARAAYDASVATYRQTVLTGVSGTSKTTCSPCGSSKTRPRCRRMPCPRPKKSLAFSRNQYKSGIINYLDLIVVQAITLTNERALIVIQGRQLISSVLLIKALGGGWTTARLPATDP